MVGTFVMLPLCGPSHCSPLMGACVFGLIRRLKGRRVLPSWGGTLGLSSLRVWHPDVVTDYIRDAQLMLVDVATHVGEGPTLGQFVAAV